MLVLFALLLSFFCLTFIYLFPLAQGLILLPLDMLVSNYSPWYSPGTILLKNPYMQDAIIQLYPWKHLVFQSIKNHIIPFWNPYQHLGMPFMASMKPGVFYPLNILYVLGEVNAWNTLLFLQIFLSITFSYLLSREFRLGILPSFLVSLAFSLNSLMVGLLEFGSDGHALLWLPLFILCAKKYLDRQKTECLLILGLSIGISISAGQLQYTGYALALLILFILFYGISLKAKVITYSFLLLAIFLGIGISAIQLIPSVELFKQSYRGISKSSEVFAEGLIKPHQLFRLFSPDFFGNPVTRDATISYIETSGYFGIIPLYFCLYAIYFARKNIFVKFFAGVFIVAILLSLKGVGQILYTLKAPLLTSGSGGRIFYLVHFSGAILSGFGLTEFLNTKDKKKIMISIFALVLVFILIVGSTAITKKSSDSVKTFFANVQFSILILTTFSLGVATYILLKRKILFAGIVFSVFVVGLTYFDLFRLGYRFLTFSNEKFLYPDMNVTRYVRDSSRDTLARNIGLVEPELATYLNVYTIETYNPLYLLGNGKLLDALQGKTDEELPVNKYFVTKGDEKLKYALDFLGVSLVVTNKDSNPSIEFFGNPNFQNSFELIYKDDRYSVYKNADAYPRFGLYYDAQLEENDEKALKLFSQRSVDFRKELLVNERLPIELEEGTGSAKMLSSNLNTQRFAVNSDKPGLFYISDAYFPGWRAEVNGEETKIYRTNYNFRSILVPQGESTIEFSYVPSGFRLGILISLVSLASLISISVICRRVL